MGALNKLLRHVTESDLVICALTIDRYTTVQDCINLFKKYVHLTDTSETDLQGETDTQNEKICKAIACVLKNWQELGFGNQYEACHAVIDHFKNLGY